MEFLIDRAASRHDQRSVAGRERLVAEVLPTLRTIADPVRRDGYLQLLARRSGVDERTLLEALRTPAPAAGRPSPRGSGDGGHVGARINLEAILAQPDALDPRAVERALEPAEATLLRLLLLDPRLVAEVAGEITPDLFVTTPARELWRALLDADRAEVSGSFDRAAFIGALEPTLRVTAQTLVASSAPLPDDDEGVRQAIRQSLLALERSRLSEVFEYARARLAEAEAGEDPTEVDRLQREVLDLQRRRLELDRAVADASLLARRRITPMTTRDSLEGPHGD
jgi:DNA primase